MLPSSPRGWLNFAVSVSDRYGRPHSTRYDFIPHTDPRMNDRRETALSIKLIVERISGGNGAGKLLMAYYVDEASWFSFSPSEQWLLNKTIRAFREELVRVGFIDGDEKVHGNL